MKIFKISVYVVWCFALIGLMISCGSHPADLGGVPVTPEMLESVSRSIAEMNTTEPTDQVVHMESSEQTEASDQESTEAVIPDIVYWTENGTVYHMDKQCNTLRHSEHILQGSIEEALLAKKERACKSCS